MGTNGQTGKEETTAHQRSDAPDGENGPDRRDPSVDQPDDDSIVDLVQQPVVVEWTKFVAALFALVGVGFGLVAILLDAAGQALIDDTAGFEALDPTITMTFFAVPYFAVVASVIVGALLGWGLDRDEKTTFLTAGISTLAGTAAFWLLGAFLGSVPFDVSVDFGGLIVSAIVAGIASAVVAAGGAWTVRNLTPDGVESTARAAGANVHATDD